MSQRSVCSPFVVVLLALCGLSPGHANENRVGPAPEHGRRLPIPRAKLEALRRKPSKPASIDVKRRPLNLAPRFDAREKPSKNSRGKLWPAAQRASTRPLRGDGTGGVVEDTLCGECPVRQLECGDPVEGVLSAGDCQFDDGSFLDVWRLDVAEPQELNIQLTSTFFDTFVFFVDDVCELLASNDDCQLNDFDESCLQLQVGVGTYYVMATSFGPGESGAYSLEVSCEDNTTCVDCRVEDITCNETLSGELFDTDCITPEGTFLDIYGFEVAEASRVHATMESDAIDTFLEVLDADCIPIARNDDCSPQNTSRSCVVLDLDPGTYHLLLTSFGAGEIGPYDVTLECFPALDLCVDCVVGPVDCGETLEGTFPSSGCVDLGGINLDLYALELEEAGPVLANLRSDAFDTVLQLFDADCEPIASNNDCEPGNFDLSCLEAVELEPGNYFIGVSSFNAGESGAFSLEVRCPDVSACRDCVTGNVGCGDSVSGVLGAGECRLDDGRARDLWRLQMFGQDSLDVDISVDTEEFEPVVSILNSSCEVICEGQSPEDCRALRQIDPGTYFVQVSGAQDGAAGSYDLQIGCSLWSVCTSCLSEPLVCGSEGAGTLEEGDCLFDDGTFMDSWPLSLDRGQTVTINLTSPDFDTFMFLLDDACFPIAANDNCSIDSTNSCITVDLSPGDYYIAANSFFAATGDYELSVSCSDITTCVDCRVGSLTCGQPVSGTLPTGDCQLFDESWVDYYELDVPADGLLDLQLTSTQFDTYLILYNEECLAVASNDDCEFGNFDVSCISADVTQGTYYVAVNSFFPGESGDYQLSASCPTPVGGLRFPGDCTGDGIMNITDALCLLDELFSGIASPVTCGGLGYSELPLADFDGEGDTTITDAVAVLQYLFDGGPPHVLGEECVVVESCETACGN